MIEVYGRTGCVYCDDLKEFVKERGIKINYTSIDNFEREDVLKLVDRADGYKYLPMVFVDGVFIGGFYEYRESVLNAK